VGREQKTTKDRKDTKGKEVKNILWGEIGNSMGIDGDRKEKYEG